MVNPALDGHEELDAGAENPLSEESERKILEMVQDQLDRPNPPDTKVLYRRAMHFIDRDVRHLSLQQFNAKFPLQVKRQRARDRPAENGSTPAGSRASGNGTSPAATAGAGSADDADARTAGERRPRSSTDRTQARGRKMAVDRSRAPSDSEEQREVVREALLDFAKAVAGADDRGDVIDVLTGVDEYVDRVVGEM